MSHAVPQRKGLCIESTASTSYGALEGYRLNIAQMGEFLDILRASRVALDVQAELGLQGLPKQASQNSHEKSLNLPDFESLTEIQEDIGDCKRCKLSSGRTHIVFGVGDPRARLMFVGEAPGSDEDLRGEPFVGAAGQLLDKMIVAMGLKRSEVYIANIIKCRPPEDRDPGSDEIMQCEPFLRRQIASVRPDVIVALGCFAVQTLLRDPAPISLQRGHWREYEGIALMPTFHPAYLLSNPDEKRKVWDDLKIVMARLGTL